MKIFRKDMFISAFIIAAAIFLIGFLIGDQLDRFRIDDATLLLNKGDLDSQSFETEGEFFNLFSDEKCDVDRSRINKLGRQLAEMGQTLTDYDAKKLTHKDSYNFLKRKYFISELKFYNMKKSLDDECGIDSPVILFFYNVEDNENSLRQGYVLDSLKRKVDDLIILSFDKDFDESVVKTLVEFYSIKEAPTLIINYDRKIDGFVSEGELFGIIDEENN